MNACAKKVSFSCLGFVNPLRVRTDKDICQTVNGGLPLFFCHVEERGTTQDIAKKTNNPKKTPIKRVRSSVPSSPEGHLGFDLPPFLDPLVPRLRGVTKAQRDRNIAFSPDAFIRVSTRSLA